MSEDRSPKSDVKIAVEVIFSEPDPAADLHREATALKLSGDWSSAIAKLELAKQMMVKSQRCYPLETWCRLPFFLQYAGRYEESMKEFDFLMDDVKRQGHECHFFESGKLRGMFIKATRYRLKVERNRVQAREIKRLTREKKIADRI